MLSLSKFTTAISPKLGKTGLKIRKASPEIFLILGIGGVIYSTVTACKATTKLDTIMNEHKEKVDKIHEYAARPKEEKETPYSEKDESHDVMITYAHTGVNLIKLYAGPVIIGTISLVAIGEERLVSRTKRNSQINS